MTRTALHPDTLADAVREAHVVLAAGPQMPDCCRNLAQCTLALAGEVERLRAVEATARRLLVGVVREDTYALHRLMQEFRRLLRGEGE